MRTASFFRKAATAVAAAAAIAAATYAAYAAVSWYRYGKADAAEGDERDELLDRFLPVYDIVERHHIRVDAPASVTLDAAKAQDLRGPAVVRAIFRARELVLGARPDERPQPTALMDVVESLGWQVVAEIPGREIVVGAVTRPWEADVTFRGLPAGDFAAFNEPGFVKIAWTLRADPLSDSTSVFRTETRAIATDPAARAAFRRYWSLASPGIRLIRRLMLRPVKRAAEAAVARSAVR